MRHTKGGVSRDITGGAVIDGAIIEDAIIDVVFGLIPKSSKLILLRK